MNGQKLTGWSGPFYEQGDVYTVYIEQDRYWVNVKNWAVMEAPNDADVDSFKFIEGRLATLLRAFVIMQFQKEPSLAERKCRTLSIIMTDTGNFIAADSLIRLMSDFPEKIQAARGKGEGRKFVADISDVKMVEIKGKNETYVCSQDFFDFFPDLTESLLKEEKRLTNK